MLSDWYQFVPAWIMCEWEPAGKKRHDAEVKPAFSANAYWILKKFLPCLVVVQESKWHFSVYCHQNLTIVKHHLLHFRTFLQLLLTTLPLFVGDVCTQRCALTLLNISFQRAVRIFPPAPDDDNRGRASKSQKCADRSRHGNRRRPAGRTEGGWSVRIEARDPCDCPEQKDFTDIWTERRSVFFLTVWVDCL